MYDMERSPEEIDKQRNRAMKQADIGGSRFRGMTYEQGVDDAIRWLTGESDDPPLSDEDYGDLDDEDAEEEKDEDEK